MEKSNKCPKCGGKMTKGSPGSYGGAGNAWYDEKDNFLARISKLIRPGRNLILTYSCEKCGYIERYVKRNQ
jgi:predicted nucleic-acid-binding Zn-ribbon protein